MVHCNVIAVVVVVVVVAAAAAATFLGVILDVSLSFVPHVDNTVRKVKEKTRVLRHLSTGLDARQVTSSVHLLHSLSNWLLCPSLATMVVRNTVSEVGESAKWCDPCCAWPTAYHSGRGITLRGQHTNVQDMVRSSLSHCVRALNETADN